MMTVHKFPYILLSKQGRRVQVGSVKMNRNEIYYQCCSQALSTSRSASKSSFARSKATMIVPQPPTPLQPKSASINQTQVTYKTECS